MSKIFRFWQLSWSTKWLFFQATALLPFCQLCVYFLPLRLLISLFSLKISSERFFIRQENNTNVETIQWVIERCVALPLYPKPKCFAQALTARMLLKQRGEKSLLILGAAINDQAMAAHAWLECEGITVTGASEKHLVHKVISFI